MFAQLRHHQGEEGQAIIMLALAMVVVLAITGLALDGGMLYWNHRRAQNAADAAAIAGTSLLVSAMTVEPYICGGTPETAILNAIYRYAEDNDIPDPWSGQTVSAYYLTEIDGRRVDLPNPATMTPWRVGTTGMIPCAEIIGLHVVTTLPQQTFLMGLIGVAETTVTTHAYAIWDYQHWCTDFAVFGINTERNKDVVAVTGAGMSITNGGIHSNGGIHLGGGGQGISLEEGRPVEFDTGADSQIAYNQIEGGPDPSAADRGIRQVDNYPLPEDSFYRFEDFAPGGFIWNEVDASRRFYFTGDIRTSDVQNADGTLRDGLYVTEGSIQLNNVSNSTTPWRATFVARGEVQVSGGIRQLPMARGVFIFTLSNNTSQGAVRLSGSYNSWAGLILAPYGDVNMSGARNSDLGGMIMANKIDLSGSDNRINHRPEFCPPNPPRVLLVQ